MSHSESYKNTAHLCFYKRRSKVMALILSIVIAYITIKFLSKSSDFWFIATLFFYFPINLLIDVVLFKFMGKRESMKKHKEAFAKNVPMSLKILDQYHMNLIDWRIAAMIVSIFYSTIFFKHPIVHFFFFVPLSLVSIPLSAWQLRSGVALKHFIGFKILTTHSDDWPKRSTYNGVPGFNVHGTFTGSSTAIGGISN